MLNEDEIRRLRLVRREGDGFPPPENFDSTSYNLSLGAKYFLLAGKESTPPLEDCSEGTGLLRIPPFACVLVGTDELVCLPAGIYGRWGLKIRTAMSGLIFQAGPQIEPGSYGRMFGLLFNMSSSERVLHYRMPLWSVDFGTVDGGSSQAVEPLEASDPVLDLGAYTAQGVPAGSLNSIYRDYVRLSREDSRRREFVLGIFLSLIVIVASIILPVEVSQIAGQEGEIARLEQRVAQLEANGSASARTSPSQPPSSRPTP